MQKKKKKNPVDKMLGESPKEIFFHHTCWLETLTWSTQKGSSHSLSNQVIDSKLTTIQACDVSPQGGMKFYQVRSGIITEELLSLTQFALN